MMNISEPTARLILEQSCSGDNSTSKVVEVKALPTKPPVAR